MKYLIWFKQVKLIAEKELNNWEVLGGWRDFYIKGLTPSQAVSEAQKRC